MKNGRLHVAFVTNDLEIGGAQQFIVSLVGALDRERFSPHVVTLSGEGPGVEAVRDLGADYHHAPAVRRAGPLRVVDPLAVARLASRLHAWRTDVVHTQLFLGNTLGRLAAFAAGTPRTIAMEHSTYFDHSRLRWRIDRHLARRSDRIVAVAEPVAQHLVAGGIPAERITVVPNGIALERFEKLPSRARARRALGLPPDAFLLGCVARLTPEKALGDLVDLLPGLRRHVPGATLLLVGEGPERANLLRRAAERGVGDAVHLLGAREDVEAILPALDLFVFPSRREGLPTALLEAMAAGVVPAVQDLPWARAVVADGMDGRRLDFADATATAEVLASLAASPALRARLSANAAQTARRFSIRRTAEALAAIYTGASLPTRR